MNGRVYDPVLGKFLSADPNVQFEKSVTAYNRYSYVSNNPLKYTDPSGYFLKKILQKISPNLATAISMGLRLFDVIVPGLGTALSTMFNAMYAAANGASAGQLAFGVALGIAGGKLGGQVAGKIGEAYKFGQDAWQYSMIQGAVSGAFTGGVNAAVGGGNVRRGILQGAASGAAMAGIQWKTRDHLANRLLQKRLDEMKYVLMQGNNDGGETLQEIQAFKDEIGLTHSESVSEFIRDGRGVLWAVDSQGNVLGPVHEGGVGGLKALLARGGRFIGQLGKAPKNLPFRSGEVILREFQVSKGTVDIAAEVSIAGKTLHLKDIAVYPRGADRIFLGTREVIAALRLSLAAEARSLGFNQLRITGTRLTGANPGKSVDILMKLK